MDDDGLSDDYTTPGRREMGRALLLRRHGMVDRGAMPGERNFPDLSHIAWFFPGRIVPTRPIDVPAFWPLAVIVENRAITTDIACY
ncbi:MAG TPA: hypothetical protein DIT28_00070 [Oxalobacteraceae bacterium]|nr:hypothetical protein [Oxalobacteraceae bacterium]HCN87569.1 hypothetical protein [Oxalobacteraceae bacterium]